MNLLFRRTPERPLRMIWEVKSGKQRKGYLVGTAHFFPFSFKKHFTDLMPEIDTLLLEGPLDEGDMEKVRACGARNDGPSLYDLLDRETIARIHEELDGDRAGAQTAFASYLDLFRKKGTDSDRRPEIEAMKPWMAFFSIWSHFVRQRGWIYSVDLEALGVARAMGREVRFLETIEEQIRALDEIPVERIVAFCERIDQWERFAREHEKRYLKGSYEILMNNVSMFPTRCESIVDRRDPVLFERMLPFVEKGGVLVCVGTIHIRGIKVRLERDGYTLAAVTL
jgi:uncharacterized protein YbaP (TraB family)